jgi:hypothetical protein
LPFASVVVDAGNITFPLPRESLKKTTSPAIGLLNRSVTRTVTGVGRVELTGPI